MHACHRLISTLHEWMQCNIKVYIRTYQQSHSSCCYTTWFKGQNVNLYIKIFKTMYIYEVCKCKNHITAGLQIYQLICDPCPLFCNPKDCQTLQCTCSSVWCCVVMWDGYMTGRGAACHRSGAHWHSFVTWATYNNTYNR